MIQQQKDNFNYCSIFKSDEIQKIVIMASEQTGRIYDEDDKPDERLLNQISKWIMYHRLPSLARHLGISDAEISRIIIPSSTPEEQCFQVRFVANFKMTQYFLLFNFF